jgi:hypothetical protein
MINSKAIGILKGFTNAEMEELNLFLISPLLNTNRKVAALFSALKEYYPLFEDKDITYWNLFRSVYPGSEYNEATVRNLLSDFMESILDFLAVKRFRKNKPEVYLNAGAELLEREWHAEFLFASKKLKTSIENLKHKEEDYHYYKMKFEILNFDYSSRILRFDTYLKDVTAGSIESELEIFFTYSKVKIMIAEALIYLQYNNRHDQYKINELIAKLNLHENNITSLIYKSFLQFYSSAQEVDYYRLRSIFKDNENVLNFDTSRNILVIMRMYTFEKSISDKRFADENRLILNTMADNGYLKLYEKGFIAETDFRNYVIVNCQAGNYDLAEEFVESNRSNLPPEIRTQNVFYCRALISFYRKQFKSSLRGLSKITYSDHHLKLSIDSLTLRCLYELGFTEEIFSRLSSLENYLRSNKSISSNEKELFRNFVTLFKKLPGLNTKNAHGKVNFLNLVTNSNTVCKTWLLDKAR